MSLASPRSLSSALLHALEAHFGDTTRLRAGRSAAQRRKLILDELGPCQAIGRDVSDPDVVADLSIRPLDDDAWERFVKLAAERASHAGAVLAGTVPLALLEDAAAAGIGVLPQPEDLLADCSCGAWEEPCRHVAILCHLVADLLDDDPFTLLLLRGRSRSEVVEGVRRRRGERIAFPPSPGIALVEPSGMSPAEAYARRPTAVPVVDRPRRGRRAAPLGVRPPADAGLDLDGLALLIEDASRRAALLLDGVGGSGLGDDERADLARRAAVAERSVGGVPALGGQSSTVSFADLVGRSGVEPDTLHRWAAGWRVGGAEGVLVSDAPPAPSEATIDAARAVLGVSTRIAAEGCSADGCQLRRDRNGRWWRFEIDRTLGWVCAAGAFDDAADAADALG